MGVTVTIRGKDFPLCLTVAAIDPITEKLGSMDEINRFLLGYPEGAKVSEDADEAAKAAAEKASAEAAGRAKVNITWMLGLLLREGEENRLMEAMFATDGDKTRRAVPDEEQLSHLLQPKEVFDYYLPVLNAVLDGNRRTLKADTSKNG